MRPKNNLVAPRLHNLFRQAERRRGGLCGRGGGNSVRSFRTERNRRGGDERTDASNERTVLRRMDGWMDMDAHAQHRSEEGRENLFKVVFRGRAIAVPSLGVDV